MYTAFAPSQESMISFRTFFNLSLGKPLLGNKELDELLKDTKDIPEKWRGKAVYFLGSINIDPDGESYIRYIVSFPNGHWVEDRRYLWTEKIHVDGRSQPTIDDVYVGQAMGVQDVVAVLEMETITRPRE